MGQGGGKKENIPFCLRTWLGWEMVPFEYELWHVQMDWDWTTVWA